jgi:hypothetical protein
LRARSIRSPCGQSRHGGGRDPCVASCHMAALTSASNRLKNPSHSRRIKSRIQARYFSVSNRAGSGVRKALVFRPFRPFPTPVSRGNLRTVDPVVAGSSPVALVEDNRCHLTTTPCSRKGLCRLRSRDPLMRSDERVWTGGAEARTRASMGRALANHSSNPSPLRRSSVAQHLT